MFNRLQKKIPRTLCAILYKINWTDFWGQIKPTYLSNGKRFIKFFSPGNRFCKFVFNEKDQRFLSCF